MAVSELIVLICLINSAELVPHQAYCSVGVLPVYLETTTSPYSSVLMSASDMLCYLPTQQTSSAWSSWYNDVFTFSLVVPPALPAFWWFGDSKAIISSVPPLPTPLVSPVPVTPPIISLPPAPFSITTVAVTAAAVAIPVSVAVAVPVSMAIPVSITVIATVPIASVTVPVVTVSVAPPVLSMSVP